MSFRTFTQTAIDCDACDEVYCDCVPISAEEALLFAARDGWAIYTNGRHFCPKCESARMGRLLASKAAMEAKGATAT